MRIPARLRHTRRLGDLDEAGTLEPGLVENFRCPTDDLRPPHRRPLLLHHPPHLPRPSRLQPRDFRSQPAACATLPPAPVRASPPEEPASTSTGAGDTARVPSLDRPCQPVAPPSSTSSTLATAWLTGGRDCTATLGSTPVPARFVARPPRFGAVADDFESSPRWRRNRTRVLRRVEDPQLGNESDLPVRSRVRFAPMFFYTAAATAAATAGATRGPPPPRNNFGCAVLLVARILEPRHWKLPRETDELIRFVQSWIP